MRGVKTVVFSDETTALFGIQPVLDEIEIIILVLPVNLIANDGMAGDLSASTYKIGLAKA